MTNLSRMAEDLIIWSTSEFSFIELSDKFASTSSVMPQKKNPDILELIRGKTAQVIGYQTGILSNLKGLPSGYNRDLQQIKVSIWPASNIAISSLLVINAVFKTMKINDQKMKKAIDSGYCGALDIAEHLVKRGIPFRTAHKIVGQLVQKASNSKKPLLALSIQEIKSSVKEDVIKINDLYKIIHSSTISSSLTLRVSQGSSGKSEQKRMISDRKKKIQAYRIGISKRTNEVKVAFENLVKKIKTVTK
jgi:argininosuccinate lyase